MIGKNILWVAKQHGHSTVTMLRTYAAWVEGAVGRDVEAIKRSMYLRPDGKGSAARPTECSRCGHRPPSGNTGSSILGNLAVDLPVEDLIYVASLPAIALVNELTRDLSYCFKEEKLESGSWLGWKDYSALRASPLRGRPRRVNTSNGANQSATTA
jgi:hypothetical protein